MEIKTPIEWNDFAEDFLDADGNIFRADQIATALNLATDREKRLVEALEQAIRDESELPDGLPLRMRAALKQAVANDDWDVIEEAFRIAVRLTKSGITDRFKALAEHKGEK